MCPISPRLKRKVDRYAKYINIVNVVLFVENLNSF